MNKEEIKDILNKLENSIKEPSTTEIDNFMEEAYEYPNFFVLDPTTNECKELYNYITNLQQQNKKYKEVIDKAINILCEIDSCNMKKQYRQANLLVLKLKDILKEVE